MKALSGPALEMVDFKIAKPTISHQSRRALRQRLGRVPRITTKHGKGKRAR